MPQISGIASSTAPATSTGVCTPSTGRDAATSAIHRMASAQTHHLRAAAAKPPPSSVTFVAWPLGNE